jgi:hypothetical protein
MRTFAATIPIRASAAAIWAILTDASRYPAWNPTVTGLEGTIALGSRIVLRARLDPKRAFRLTVSKLVPPYSMVWRGGLPLGLFTGERTFTLTPAGDGTTTFAMRESFSGPLAPLISRVLPDLQPEFDAFADALKREAERR